MSQLIIGLGNKARHGKDTFAAAIDNHYATQYYAAQKHGLSSYKPVIVQHLAFADELYKEVNDELKRAEGYFWIRRKIWSGPTRSHFIDLPSWVQPDPNPEISKRAPYGKHSKLLQWWGTEYRRAQDTDYWVKKWKTTINPNAHIVITTDMRFLNEAAAIKSAGGITVQVNRFDKSGLPFVDPGRDPLHASEVQLDGYNYDYKICVKTGDQALLEEWAITLVHYLRALKGK